VRAVEHFRGCGSFFIRSTAIFILNRSSQIKKNISQKWTFLGGYSQRIHPIGSTENNLVIQLQLAKTG